MDQQPNFLNDPILNKLLDKIGVEFDPETVPVQPAPYALPHNCFLNVQEKVRRDGGQVHYGWAIHETNLLREAERHAVWEDNEGNLLDITPQETGEEEILFVSDNDWEYTGKRVDNIRVNRTDNPVVDDFITLCECVHTITSYGTEDENWQITLTPPVAAVYELYNGFKQGVQEFIYRGGRPYSPCPCGKALPYRKCHGYKLRERVAQDLALLKEHLNPPPANAPA
ncbi:hypothetical protein KLP40_14540 [Hymenobacter sp. NST-14]|uniref:hypothetical protein n=1 Tax=Hymenobacter piscis TaxID=2839984 RepID=UPI001C009C3A|nr:hypothetical protein [Hymenobacter piscis]MBT9394386.1 hypothetical protein [Hymenobacter piscis]